MPMARPGRRWAIMRTPNAPSPTLSSWRRAGPTPGSITASRATARARSRTPRRRCARRCARAPGHAAATANLGAFLRITGEAESGRSAAARDARARAGQCRRPAQSGRRPAAGGARRPRRSRCSTAGELRRAIRARSRHWHLQQAARAAATRPRCGGASGARRARGARADPAATRAAVALAARAAGAAPKATSRAPRDEAEQMEAALADMGPDAVPEHPHHGALRSRQILVGPERRTRAPSRIGSRATELLRQFQPFSRDDASRLRRRQYRAVRARRLPRRRARRQRRSGAGVHRRHAALRHHAERADPRRPSRRASAPANGWRSAQAFAALGGRATTPAAVRRIAALDSGDARRGGGSAISRSCTRSRRATTRIVDKMPGNFNLSRPRRADAAGREDHPLRARSARHRAVDLHLPLPRRAWLCARSRRSRLVHRPARPADGALARRAAEPDPDRAAGRLGDGFRRHAGARAGPSDLPHDAELRALLRSREPRAHGQPRAGAPAGERARSRAAGAPTRHDSRR